jgi:hypothetical protein
MENKHYIYLHRNPSNYEVFYVGQGKVDKNGKFTRSKSKCSRSRWWNNYVNKHGNPIVEVIEENLSIDDVNLREKFYIKLYGRCDINEGSLVNMSDGGDGSGPRSLEYRIDCSNRMKGENHPMYGKKHTKEWIENNSKSHTGVKRSLESRKKQGDTNRGSKRTEETKKKMSIALSGENNPMYGRTGTSNPASKLDWDKVNEIRELYKKGDTSFRKLGKLFNVANCTIESIIKNKTWKILIND